jgi:hypothetical protein
MYEAVTTRGRKTVACGTYMTKKEQSYWGLSMR